MQVFKRQCVQKQNNFVNHTQQHGFGVFIPYDEQNQAYFACRCGCGARPVESITPSYCCIHHNFKGVTDIEFCVTCSTRLNKDKTWKNKLAKKSIVKINKSYIFETTSSITKDSIFSIHKIPKMHHIKSIYHHDALSDSQAIFDANNGTFTLPNSIYLQGFVNLKQDNDFLFQVAFGSEMMFNKADPYDVLRK